jgi:hypothetical protein
MPRQREIRYILEVINPRKQRYETHGDWIPGEPARIVSSRFGNEYYEFLLLFHELIEYELCKKRKITDKEIVAFDKKFERERKKGLHRADAEPGNSQKAPYRYEHRFALKLERMMAKQLGVDWKEYSKKVMVYSVY